MVIPDETEEIAPILYIIPFVASMASHEPLEKPMCFVDWLKWILFVGKVLCHLARIGFSFRVQSTAKGIVRLLAVVNNQGSWSDVAY